MDHGSKKFWGPVWGPEFIDIATFIAFCPETAASTKDSLDVEAPNFEASIAPTRLR